MTLQLQRADIFFTRGRGIFNGATRFLTRGFGESRTKVNHVGLVVAGGPIDEAIVVEALRRVVEHRLVDRYGWAKRHDAVAVFRPTNLTTAEIEMIVQAAQSYVGKKYGALKILAHLADWALLGAYVFRRLARMDDYLALGGRSSADRRSVRGAGCFAVPKQIPFPCQDFETSDHKYWGPFLCTNS